MWSVSLRSIFHRRARLTQWPVGRAFIFLVSALYQITHKKDNPFIINTTLFIVERRPEYVRAEQPATRFYGSACVVLKSKAKTAMFSTTTTSF
jgi:hypothetical protein